MGRACAVVGLGYGDEGKGAVVDFLARLQGGTVVRFSGGAQAGHNVVLPDGRHHTFSQFGSGTFVPGVRTHLSRHMLVHPLALQSEEEHLQSVGVRDAYARLTIEDRALVTNPFQVAVNRILELFRGSHRHGSCGMGVNETVADVDRYGEKFAIRACDLRDPATLRRKLTFSQGVKIAEAFPFKMTAEPSPEMDREWALLSDKGVIDDCVRRYTDLADRVRIVDGDHLLRELRGPDAVIFEGSQGVLLDQDYGFYPYCTRSTVTFDNALDLLEGHPVVKLGVTRTYATRHGAGPLVTEDSSVTFPEGHNDHTIWQQEFRRGHFDLAATRYAANILGSLDGLVVTHRDRIPGNGMIMSVGYEPEVDFTKPQNKNDQHRLTDRLLRARPRYEVRDLLGELDSIADVVLSFYGPTFKDAR